MARPTYQAPAGRLTLRDAAEQVGISYHVAYTRITDVALPIPHERDGNIYTIAEEDLSLLVRDRGEPQDKRIPVMNRVAPERHAAWKRAAGDRKVSTWLAELGDRAAGIEPAAAADEEPAKRARTHTRTRKR